MLTEIQFSTNNESVTKTCFLFGMGPFPKTIHTHNTLVFLQHFKDCQEPNWGFDFILNPRDTSNLSETQSLGEHAALSFVSQGASAQERRALTEQTDRLNH